MLKAMIIFLIFLCIACNSKSHKKNTGNIQEMTISGKITLEDNSYSYQVDSLGNILDSFTLKRTDSIFYSGFNWLNKSDSLLSEESFEQEKKGIYKTNIICIDNKGRYGRTIYFSQNGETASGPQLSKNDRYVLFTVSKIPEPDDLLKKGLAVSVAIKVLDLNGKQIAVFDSVGFSPALGIHESPWLLDETHFLYSLSKMSSIYIGEKKLGSEHLFIAGVYIGNIYTGQKKLLIPDARFAVCSPADSSFCYVMYDNTIWHKYLNDKVERIIYKGDEKEYVSNMHWTPNGKYLYVLLYIKERDEFVEKLIDIEAGREIPFKAFRLGLSRYTWK